jgi:Caspase domain
VSSKLALIIAVEGYADKRISVVDYAEADAKSFAEAIKLHGYDSQTMLLNGDATHGRMQSNIRRNIERLRAEDEFIFYYAGHGFSNKGHNFVTSFDTDPDDLEATSVRLQWIFDLIEKTACKRIAIFLDACESGITKLVKRRALYSTMSEGEIEAFFRKSEYRVCFSACKTTESSYPSKTLKHGIWTFHIVEALTGNAPEALETGQRLTAISLLNYLSTSVPRTLRKTYSTPEIQTPWLYGGQNRDFEIANLSSLLAEKHAAKPGYDQLKSALLRERSNMQIKSLSGFRKWHHVPDNISDSTKSFVESIAQQEIEERADLIYNAIKKYLAYKRKDMTYEAGRILTPDFEYSVSCTQDDDDPEVAVLLEELVNIKPQIIQNEDFNKVFKGAFSELVFEFTKKLNITKLIDNIEDSDRKDIELDYPKDLSWCELTFDGSPISLRLDGRELSVTSAGRNTPQELLQVFFESQKLLAGTPLAAALRA